MSLVIREMQQNDKIPLYNQQMTIIKKFFLKTSIIVRLQRNWNLQALLIGIGQLL